MFRSWLLDSSSESSRAPATMNCIQKALGTRPLGTWGQKQLLALGQVWKPRVYLWELEGVLATRPMIGNSGWGVSKGELSLTAFETKPNLPPILAMSLASSFGLVSVWGGFLGFGFVVVRGGGGGEGTSQAVIEWFQNLIGNSQLTTSRPKDYVLLRHCGARDTVPNTLMVGSVQGCTSSAGRSHDTVLLLLTPQLGAFKSL